MKKEFIKKFTNFFFLRMHMSVILIITCLASVLISKGLFSIGFENLSLRYSLSFILTYFLFIGQLKIWLLYIKKFFEKSKAGDPELVENLDVFIFNEQSSNNLEWKGSGGKFSGAGASGSFGEDSDSISDKINEKLETDMPDEAAPIFLVLAIIAIILIIVFGGVWVIIESPVFLGDIAFEFLIGLGLLKNKDKLKPVSWITLVIAKSYKIALILLILIIGLTLTINYYNPNIKNSRQILEWLVTID